MFLLIKYSGNKNIILKMFASKYLSVILMCVFRIPGGVVSSGLLTSGSFRVLSVHVCWQWKGLPSGRPSSQEALEVLNHLES